MDCQCPCNFPKQIYRYWTVSNCQNKIQFKCSLSSVQYNLVCSDTLKWKVNVSPIGFVHDVCALYFNVCRSKTLPGGNVSMFTVVVLHLIINVWLMSVSPSPHGAPFNKTTDTFRNGKYNMNRSFKALPCTYSRVHIHRANLEKISYLFTIYNNFYINMYVKYRKVSNVVVPGSRRRSI